MTEWIFDNVMGPFLALMVLATFILFGWAIYDHVTADRFSLRTDLWVCTEWHHEMVGKITHKVCDDWRSK